MLRKHSGLAKLAAPQRAVRADQASTANSTDMQVIADVSKTVDERLATTIAAAAAAAAALNLATSTPLRERLSATIAKVQKGLLERETEVRVHRPGGGGGAQGLLPQHRR